MSRSQAIRHAQQQFDSGEFRQTLARRIAIPTENQNPDHSATLADYLDTEMRPAFRDPLVFSAISDGTQTQHWRGVGPEDR